MEKQYHILIVDDDPSWQKKFKRYLKNESLVISTASNYQEGAALIETQTFDLAILDVNLTWTAENYDGLRLGQKLWRKDKNTKIIIVSGSENVLTCLSTFIFMPNFILKKESIEQDEFVTKIHLALAEGSFQG